MAKTATPSSANLRIVQRPKAEVLRDYELGWMSRYASLIGRKEVLTGKAKFGIFGDGKEVAQLALAKAFQKGDWRSGYYRDQTMMFALGVASVKEFFAQLYADTDQAHDPMSCGRQMNSHFANRFIDDAGNWCKQTELFNTAADLSPTGGQMARLVGLAYASKLYRKQQKALGHLTDFSISGNEVAFGTIGNASTSEGIFWEAVNAAGVLQIPMAISVWDDGYGISVPSKYQTTKESISEILKGFQRDKNGEGFDIYVVKGWDYEALCETYLKGIEKVRREHVPAIFHIVEMTQPQGHSTSGSHERYKSKERLSYEDSIDCLTMMRSWMIEHGIAKAGELDKIETESQKKVEELRSEAWNEYLKPINDERDAALTHLREAAGDSDDAALQKLINDLQKSPTNNRKLIHQTLRRALAHLRLSDSSERQALADFESGYASENAKRYNTHLHSEHTAHSALSIEAVAAEYDEKPEMVDGRQIIQRAFDKLLEQDPRIFIMGEDVGKLGGVNLEFDGLSEKHGELRVSDTGIREATILGQAIGAAMRGLRPVADIQYLDYLLYCFQVMSDDLASLTYRTAGGQTSPVIVRTKGHRLEGIWHTGSPMGTIIHGIRGMHVCVPRNMTQAVGMYHTLFAAQEPALVIEVLNAYRNKERVPANLHDFRVALGVPEVLQEGADVTVVTYGACVRIAQEAAALLAGLDVSVELIDIQTLLPFDRFHLIRQSLEKTNALVVMDEDVPGGASSFILQKILEEQQGYECLDGAPRTLTAKGHRSPYASDGDYYSKPSAEDLMELVFTMMQERDPGRFSGRLRNPMAP